MFCCAAAVWRSAAGRTSDARCTSSRSSYTRCACRSRTPQCPCSSPRQGHTHDNDTRDATTAASDDQIQDVQTCTPTCTPVGVHVLVRVHAQFENRSKSSLLVLLDVRALAGVLSDVRAATYVSLGMQLDQVLASLEAQLANFGPREGVDFDVVLKDEHAHVRHGQR